MSRLLLTRLNYEEEPKIEPENSIGFLINISYCQEFRLSLRKTRYLYIKARTNIKTVASDSRQCVLWLVGVTRAILFFLHFYYFAQVFCDVYCFWVLFNVIYIMYIAYLFSNLWKYVKFKWRRYNFWSRSNISL